MKINRDILKLALPSIITNITVPLLGIVDLSISGHLGDIKYIAAIAVGAMMFNLLYWNFSFLRMGTTGMTAQFLGKKDARMISITLYRALFIALSLGLAMLIFRTPLRELALLIISPSEQVRAEASVYFDICIFGAPALLSANVLKGWFLGMQNSKYPMIVAISINLLNIAISLIVVFALGFGFRGIAYGTIIAEYMGLIIALSFLFYRYRKSLVALSFSELLNKEGLGRFFKINGDIFVRSVCLLSVTIVFTAIGARAGDLILAVNAIIMQLFLFFTYFMDGFAFSGEALIGRFLGNKEFRRLEVTIKWLMIWGFGIAIIFTVVYGSMFQSIVTLLTDEVAVANAIVDYRLWCILIPVVSVSAFIFDGVFVGLTATRPMVMSIFIAASSFFAIYYLPSQSFSNDRLWLAFVVYLGLRGIVLALYYKIRKAKLFQLNII
ncbi:MAG: MATE family efflux transporter [Muribaculaceae bacterium]|nr:MATE family efflux transporter [Muribaculaceae bacterium]